MRAMCNATLKFLVVILANESNVHCKIEIFICHFSQKYLLIRRGGMIVVGRVWAVIDFKYSCMDTVVNFVLHCRT